ncbi:MAG: helix-turn-helix transcriptional regulator [Pseudobdellovibrionaceae bacterium]|nr:helix-turn-helix transcriptional regulator [Bdellovibrionales bacterium]USN46582.1 MAG: helix-turn-helix transcriptional regulator [Pseudobdellovibrionaceae bacterium]
MSEKKQLLGDYLREKRLAADLSQKEVAERLGYGSAQFVSNWERGLSSPPLEALKTITDLFKINPQELIDLILDATRNQLENSLKVKAAKSRRTSRRRQA